MKIKSYQGGGMVVYSPFVPGYQQAGQAQGQESADPENKTEKITGTIQKEIIDVLKENGLPSDVDVFMNHADQLLSGSSSLFSLSDNRNREYTMAELMRVHSFANRVKHNKKLYDDASNHLTSESAWSEVATDSGGRMYVYTKDGIQLIDPREYDLESMQALTNKQMLDLRANNPELAFDDTILTSASNAISMTSITKYLKDVISSFATNSNTGYSAKSQDTILGGFDDLQRLGPDGYYKIMYENKGTMNDTEKGITAALNYLMNSMDKNMHNLLMAKTAAEGRDPNNLEDVYGILASALFQHTGTKRSVDFDSSATATRTKGSGEGDKWEDLSIAQRFADGNGPKPTHTTFRPDGKTAISFYVQDFGNPTDKDKKPIEQTNLRELFNQSEELRSAMRNSVTFGDQKVAEGELNQIVWAEGTSLKRANAPVERLQDGSYQVMFDLFDQLNEIKDWIDRSNVSDMEINTMLQDKFGDLIIWDAETKSPIFNVENTMGIQIAPVAMFEGYMSRNDSYTIQNKRSKWMTQLIDVMDRGQVRDIRDNYEIIATHGSLTYNKKDKSTSDTYDAGRAGKMYRAPVFIVLNPQIANVQTGKNYVPKDWFYNPQKRAENLERANNMITGFSSQQ